jgi:hypothetical protein
MHRGHPQLKRAWEDLVANFQDVGAHIRFVEEAEKRHDLAYAAERYTRISEAAPDNEIAKDMLKDIEERVARGAAVRSSALNLKVPNSLGLMIALALGVAMVVAGFVAEPLRNITGIGMALIFLSIASRFLFVGR